MGRRLEQLQGPAALQEALFGELTKLEALGGLRVGTYDDGEFPPVSSLALVPMIGGSDPLAPTGAAFQFDGEATILGQTMDIAVFRKA